MNPDLTIMISVPKTQADELWHVLTWLREHTVLAFRMDYDYDYDGLPKNTPLYGRGRSDLWQ